MFICPDCKKEFKQEQEIQKHFLSCWKKHHSCPKTKSAPKGKDIETREINEDIMNFFKEINNGRSFN